MSHAHRRSLLAFVVCAVIFGFAAASDAKSYYAERYDSNVRVLADGTLDVTETVRFNFEDGTFREVFREIPLRRTDGVEILSAAMQGTTLPFGKETGTAEVERRNAVVRVTWRFSPVEGVTREFVLQYRVRGAVRRDAGGDVLAWRATPGSHNYRIAASRIEFVLPTATAAQPVVNSRGAGSVDTSASGERVEITAENLANNGWVEASLTFPRGSVASAAPGWQQQAEAISAQVTIWLTIAGAVFVAGLIVLFAARQGYDPPPAAMAANDAYFAAPPETGAPAIAGVLAANGRISLEHAMAALLTLADRGFIEIRELPRRAFGRDFVIARPARTAGGELRAHEQTLLETVFKGASREGVKLSRARLQLTRRFREFTRTMKDDLRSDGLLDEQRGRVRARYQWLGVAFLIAAGAGAVPVLATIERTGPAALLIPAALLLVGLAGFAFSAAVTPLSNEGARRGERWREYRKHLGAVARGKRAASGTPVGDLLPFAIALGLSQAWSTFLKRSGQGAPAWFHALPNGSGHAFPMFVATGGAGSHGGGAGGGAGAGAAGGGASGAH